MAAIVARTAARPPTHREILRGEISGAIDMECA
jgi:hypothetical protein